jgi:hypothetical protein
VSERLCVVCQRRHYERPNVCEPDRAGMPRLLDDIVELYALLPAALMPGSDGGEKVSGSREAPLPLRVDVLDLTMPARTMNLTGHGRHHLVDQVGTIAVASILDTWVRDWAELRGDHLPVPTVASLAGWMRERLDWACDEHPAIDDWAAEMRALVGSLRAATGQRTDRRVIGRCPTVDEDSGQPCGATLTADPWIDIIECPRCSTRWDRAQWQWLGEILRDTEAA